MLGFLTEVKDNAQVFVKVVANVQFNAEKAEAGAPHRLDEHSRSAAF